MDLTPTQKSQIEDRIRSYLGDVSFDWEEEYLISDPPPDPEVLLPFYVGDVRVTIYRRSGQAVFSWGPHPRIGFEKAYEEHYPQIGHLMEGLPEYAQKIYEIEGNLAYYHATDTEEYEEHLEEGREVNREDFEYLELSWSHQSGLRFYRCGCLGFNEAGRRIYSYLMMRDGSYLHFESSKHEDVLFVLDVFQNAYNMGYEGWVDRALADLVKAVRAGNLGEDIPEETEIGL